MFISLALSFELETCISNYLPAMCIWMFPKVKIFPHKLASTSVFSTPTKQTTQTHSFKNMGLILGLCISFSCLISQSYYPNLYIALKSVHFLHLSCPTLNPCYSSVVRDQGYHIHLRACQKCSVSGTIPDLLNQNLHLISPHVMCMYKKFCNFPTSSHGFYLYLFHILQQTTSCHSDTKTFNSLPFLLE